MACKPLMCVHWIELIMIEIFKISHKIGPSYLHELFARKIDISEVHSGLRCLNLELYSMVSTL